VTRRMLDVADALIAYRTYPHVDMAETGERAAQAQQAADALLALASPAAQWRMDFLSARQAVTQAMAWAEQHPQPVLIADTQDNPGAGGDSNTTCMLHALLQQGAGKRFPSAVASGLFYHPEVAAKACAAGAGADIDVVLGVSVPTYSGMSDAPVSARAKVVSVSDGRCVLKGPMMRGMVSRLGPSACLHIEGVLVAVVSGKAQLFDRKMLRMLGMVPEAMKLIVLKSSNHFRADFEPIASKVLVAKASGPMAADPGDLPWRKLSVHTRTRA
jgi:microcystin degradation protein MlrC